MKYQIKYSNLGGPYMNSASTPEKVFKIKREIARQPIFDGYELEIYNDLFFALNEGETIEFDVTQEYEYGELKNNYNLIKYHTETKINENYDSEVKEYKDILKRLEKETKEWKELQEKKEKESRYQQFLKLKSEFR